MRVERADRQQAKGWYLGPWNSDSQVAIGYANVGVDEPHYHQQTREIYLVARGEAQLRVEQQTFRLQAGDVAVIEPGEAHTFISSSPEYFHFVIHEGGLQGEAARVDKVPVERTRLGLA